MRKRFISGLTAVCMLGILLTNSFLSVPASAVIAEVGASVAAGLLMGTLFNQMTGGTGYDFTDAFSDCFSFVVTPHNQFIRDNPDADIYLPDGTPYYVDGQYAAAIELKKGEAEIAKMVQSHWNIAESLGLKTPQETIHAAMEAFNAGLADGSIVIHVDDDGNISMPTSSWCTSVSDIYDRLGVLTSKNGTSRSLHTWVLSSQYIDRVYYDNSFTFVPYVDFPDVRALWSSYFLPFVITKDGDLLFFKLGYQFSSNSYWCTSSFAARYGDSFGYSLFDNKVNVGSESNLPLLYHTFSISSDLISVSLDIDGAFSFSQFSPVHEVFNIPSGISDVGISGKLLSSLVTSDIDSLGWVYVNNYSKFEQAVKQGEIEKNEQVTSIPLTGVENTIGNMGLAGVGSGATKGTVSVNSKTKDITETNDATKEAELVIEQGNAGDIDTPDVDSITDKFPFSLPFDIYNLVTIFVRDEQKPIFEIPIQTTLDIAGEDYKVDEKIVLDLTQFQLNGVDIIRVFTRTVTYIAFIAFLIKITPHVIKH